jgi:uncharacterized protein YxjI
MTQSRHWTPKSGFFPCAAKEGNCPKQDQHHTVGTTKNELKSNFRSAENEARTAMLNGEIDADQYNKAVRILRADTKESLRDLRETEEQTKKTFFSTSLKRGTAVFAGGAILVGSLTGCGVTVAELPSSSANVSDSKSVIQTLNEAEKISLDKKVISLGDSWNVSADGKDMAELKGQAIPVLGDTYSMYSTNNNLVASEAEQVVRTLHGATTYDYENKERGTIDQNLSLILQSYTIKDTKGNVIGTADQNMGMTLDFDIKNADGRVEYKVKKAMVSWGASLEVERQVSNPEVDAQDAVWLSVIVNEVNEAKASKSK